MPLSRSRPSTLWAGIALLALALAAHPADAAPAPAKKTVKKSAPAPTGFQALISDVSNWAGPPVHSGRSMVKGYSVYTGYLVERGFGEASVWQGDRHITPNLVGVTYWERQGIISGMLMAIVATVAGAAESVMPKNIEHEDIGNIRYTTITYHSDEERRRIVDEAAERGGRIAAASNQSFELTAYMRNLPGAGDASGFRMNLFFGIPMGSSALFELGLGGGVVDAIVGEFDSALPARVHSFYAGVPLRFSYGFRWLALYSQWEWNIAGHFKTKGDFDSDVLVVREVRNSPLRLGAQTNLFGRLFVDASAVTPDVRSLQFGWRLAAGMRF